MTNRRRNASKATNDGAQSMAHVRGRIMEPDGRPVSAATVSAFAKRIRGQDEILGKPVKTDKEGRYDIAYKLGKRGVDLYVEVKRGSEKSVRSAIVLNASAEETLDLVVGDSPFRGPSEYERLHAALEPFLQDENIKTTELAGFSQEELALLSAKTGVEPQYLALIRQSAKLALETKLPAQVFYGLARQKMPLTLPGLLAQDPGKRRAALRRALEKNQISQRMRAEAEQALDRLDERAVADALKTPRLPGETTLGAMLGAAGVARDKQDKLVRAYVKHDGEIDKFWEKVRCDPAFSDFSGEEVDKIQFTLQLGVLTHNHVPLVQALQRKGVAELRDLAKFDKSDWLKLINSAVEGHAVGLPPDLKAAGLKEEEYADLLYAIVEDAFPTAAVSCRIQLFPDPEPLKKFFERNPAFDMRTTPAAVYLRQNVNALDGIAATKEQKAGLIRRLKGLERTYRLAPKGARVDTMRILLKDGVDSAQKIRVMGRAAFLRNFGTNEALGAETAQSVFLRANNAAAAAAILVARHHAIFDGASMAVLPRRPDSLKKFPDYETLFGSLDFCSCEHCQSVYSPAAYLVDLLHWLLHRPAEAAGKSALDVLFNGRRADIGAIELSCKNTNTPLPYIDLVNETLELAVAPAGAPPHYQTKGNAANLAVHPEHLLTEAYEVLAGAKASSGKDAVYPFNLPFNLWLEEARTYLGQLGLPRHRLMEALHAAGRDAARTDSAVARETLGLSELQWKVIAGETLSPSRNPQDFWGVSGSWVNKLKTVSLLLLKASPPLSARGMEFEELSELLRARFIQKADAVGVWFEGGACDTSRAELDGLNAAVLGRLHRFIRLQRRLGWTVQDLDQAVAALGNGVLNSALLVKLAHVLRLEAELNVPPAEMLHWWGPLDTRRWKTRLVRGRPAAVPAGAEGFGFVYRDGGLTPQPAGSDEESFYDRLFQNKSVNAEADPAFGVNAAGNALVDEILEIADHVPTIIAAVGVTAEDLAKILERLPNAKLSLANLSALFRHASLAKAMGLSIGQLVSLLALTRIDPFDAAHTENTLRFAEEARAVRESGFAIEELDYLLRHIDTKPASLEPQNERIAVLLKELRDALRKVETDNPVFANPATELTFDELRSLIVTKLLVALPAEDLEKALAVIDLRPDVPRPGDVEQKQFIEEKFGAFLDVADAKIKLVGAAQITDRTQRLAYVLGPLLRYIRRAASETAAIERIGGSLDLHSAVAAPLLRNYFHHPGAGGGAAISIFLDRALIDFEKKDAAGEELLSEPADLPNQFAAYKRLHKAALLLRRFRVSGEELPWVLKDGPAQGTLDFDALPIAPPLPLQIAYAPWARLRDAIALRDRLTTGKLLDLFESAAAGIPGGDAAAAYAGLLNELEKRTRWNRSDLEFLAGARGFNLRYPDDWKDERALKRLDEAMAAIRRIGLSAEVLWPWSTIPAEAAGQAAQAQAVKQAVRARCQEAQWLEIARPLRDRLRERQRDALAGWLIAHDGRFENAHDLFGHFLLDVEMSPCQMTSRIKQASSSVQLFVQRALMNVEQDLRLSTDDAAEWTWMKSYRVWEANRKIFLYPENWIEPELRDDKTPFFEELENNLLQSEITPDSVEQAMLSYLERLDEVARLEVAGLFHQNEDNTDILHVFARTRGTPPRYFYRQRVDASHWTPWEKVEVDIAGDHLLPVIYKRRLYIFWAQISAAAVEAVPQTPSGGGGNSPSPERYFQIRLGWSVYRNGQWAPKKLSSKQIGETLEDYCRLSCALSKTDTSKTSEFFFTAYELDDDLIVEPIRSNKAGNYRLDRFRLSGCDGTMSIEANFDLTPVVLRKPEAMTNVNQSFAGFRGSLVLPVRNATTGFYEKQTALSKTPSSFEIVVPQQKDPFVNGAPFFFQDKKRSFFVESWDTYRTWVRQQAVWTIPEKAPLDIPRLLPETYKVFGRPPVPPEPDPWFFFQEDLIVNPAPVEVLAKPALLTFGPAAAPGLLATGAKGLADTFGARIAYVGNQSVEPRSRQIAVQSAARIVTLNPGQELLTLRTATLPQKAEDMCVLTMNNTFFLPTVIGELFQPVFVLKEWTGVLYRFHAFHHPYLSALTRQLSRFGLDGMLDPSPGGPEPLLRRQRKHFQYFVNDYGPVAVESPYPKDDFDFSYSGAYSVYNWELFFHVPFEIAVRLSKNQRFEDALRWFHYIFDPTESSREPAPQRFWKIGPFFDLFHGEDVEAGPIHELLLLLSYAGSDPAYLKARDDLIRQIAEWRKNPFKPHAIARLRLTAYQKAVVMKYLDNLIEWGDQLFRRDTMESINEAIGLYILAAQILGRRPQRVEAEPPAPKTFNQLLAQGLDEFSNALVEEVEGYLPEVPDQAADVVEDDVPVMGPTIFFCVPPNDKLITDYWDRVADRLFKIRHCMTIEGVVRQLPLFEPPIEPGLLVRAAAAGIDLSSALSDLNAPLPHHRFQILVQKAVDLCGDVRMLGGALLSTLEKKDAEALALLRADQEVRLQTAIQQVREKQIEEAKEILEGLKKSKENAEIRLRFYQTRDFMNAGEQTHVSLLLAAGVAEFGANSANLVASILAAIPDFDAGASGFGGSPVVKARFGGSNLANIARAVADGFRTAASALDRASQMSGIMAGYVRRAEDWRLQSDLAVKDIEAIEKQILAAEIRVAISDQELENLKLQIEQGKEIEAFLREKYTNAQLYQWMVGQLSSLYFQSYQLAYDMAKRAERAWRFELALPDKSFIQFGYWDSLKKGLLAGERLHYDLKRMDAAYIESHRREYELTRHVSLRMLDPISLVELRRNGECFVRIPEAWFDLDGPGHYLRRIKTVALSIPSVTGPYAPVRCTLTLLRSEVRINADSGAAYRRTGPDDSRFRDDTVGIQSIVTSRAQEDSGLFDANLRDECYLPFEGAGAASEWRIELPKQFPQFDYNTISDVILHIRYTARDGGSAFKQTVEGEIKNALRDQVLGSQDAAPAGAREGLFHLMSSGQQFVNAWHQFLNPPDGQTDQLLTLKLGKELFPFAFQNFRIKITGVELFLDVDDIAAYAAGTPVRLDVVPPEGGVGQQIELPSVAGKLGGLPHGSHSYGASPKDLGDWTIRFTEAANGAAAAGAVTDAGGHKRLNPASVRDLIIAWRYRIE